MGILATVQRFCANVSIGTYRLCSAVLPTWVLIMFVTPSPLAGTWWAFVVFTLNAGGVIQPMLVAQCVNRADQNHIEEACETDEKITASILKAAFSPVAVCASLFLGYVILALATDLRLEDYPNLWWIGVSASIATAVTTLLFPTPEQLRALYPKHLFNT